MKKIIGIFVCTLLVLIALSGGLNGKGISKFIKPSFETNTLTYDIYYKTSFENYDDWESDSFSGPDLWHQTSFDYWTAEYAMACFREDNKHYENNMDFNYLISPTFSVNGALAMIMNFYCKFITEDSDDHWGVVLYDPGTDSFLSHVWTAVEDWRHLPYETYDYHSMWMGPLQPVDEYQFFDILDAYEHWYNLGYFRDSHGNTSYDFRIGFVFYESDGTGYTNAEAEANGEYWSGLLIDDVVISRAIVNKEPNTPSTPEGPSIGRTKVIYEYTTDTTDPNGHDVRYGWDWNDDDFIDEWTGYSGSGELITVEHSWATAGIYNVKVKAEDIYGAQSDFSLPKTVDISDNNPPNKPDKPTGSISGKPGKLYSYQTSTIEPDGDQVFYMWDWDDGTPLNWTGPYTSGETIIESHIWANKGVYNVKVKAKDIYGIESTWSDSLSVTMPKTKAMNQLFIQFLQRFIKHISV